MWPEGRIAARSFSDTPITRGLPPPAIFNSSPTVLTSSRLGEEPGPLPPSNCVLASLTLVTCTPSSRSYQSLATIPLIEGVAPVRNVLWPTAVIAGTWM